MKSKENIDKANHETRKKGYIKKYGRVYIVELVMSGKDQIHLTPSKGHNQILRNIWRYIV